MDSVSPGACRERGAGRRGLAEGLLATATLALCVFAAAAAAIHPQEGQRALSPAEEAIAAAPFAAPNRQARLRAILVRGGPTIVSPGRGDMGWRWPDKVYWRRIPAAARQVPSSWYGLPWVRFRNTEVGSDRKVWLRVTPEYDQWLLHDYRAELWACISVHRTTRRVYFMQLHQKADGTWVRGPAKDHCFSCHPSGPRVIRPFDDPVVDRQTLAEFNRRILGYGALSFWGSVDPATRGRPHKGGACEGCHDGRSRGRLYEVNKRAIAFKRHLDGTMPPSALRPPAPP